ncbi:MAG TPA: glycosyltransferase family 2 protein, partial [Micromonospora sp.]
SSAAILARYAARDPRLRVVTHDRNRGLGAARNTGLAHATSEYVWFVDSDDWLPDGTLPAVAERLTRTDCDLLVVGFSRVYWDRRVRYEAVSGVGGGRAVPETFTLADQPGLLRVLHIACNKVVRRRFLDDLGLAFAPGWYEDVSFSLPLMLAADRISLLDRNCYLYRQRRDGGITQTVSERHFEVFGQWDRVFAFLDARPDLAAELRGPVFDRMIWHLLQVLAHPRRVAPELRRRFFREMSRRYRAHRPTTGYRVPGGGTGVRHRLVELGSYQVFEALRGAHRLRGALNRRRRAPRSGPSLTQPVANPASGSPSGRVEVAVQWAHPPAPAGTLVE